MQKITPFLWFDNNAEEAMNFYTSIFKDSRSSAFAAILIPDRGRAAYWADRSRFMARNLWC